MLTKNQCLVIKLYHIGSSSAETELPEITEDNTLKIILGIDTGGTYTDAVACNAETYEIYAEAKSLTTRQDLSVGIHNALAQLPQEYLTQAEMVSLSTTLTTNACVENKGCRALLILFGMDEESSKRLGAEFGVFDSDDIWYVDTGTHMDGTIDRIPDWDAFAQKIRDEAACYEAFALVEIYARKTGACLEQKARDIIHEISPCPVVCGHELFNELNVLKRGANALLNARLVPLISRFLEAIDKAMEELGIHAAVRIVRSDGTLMSRDFAVKHPIETLLCGPVASVMGAEKLTGCENAMIVDMGGTTSDIALMKHSIPVRVEDFVHIGGWTTFMKGLFIDTFGLGGDTGVRYRNGKLELDVQRLIPSCILAAQYPEILPELKQLAKGKKHTRFIHEYLVLQHMPSDKDDYTKEELAICKLIQKRPYSLGDIAKKLKLSIYDIHTERLERNGIILRSGLTPTDIMHLKGDFQAFHTQASLYTASFVAHNLEISVEELCDQVYSKAKYRLFRNLARILMERENPELQQKDTAILDYILEKQWNEYEQRTDHSKNDPSESFSFHIKSCMSIIGLGGPSSIFVPDVAKALGVTAIVPELSQVANALGAALGNITFSVTVTVDCLYGYEGKSTGLTVTSSGERIPFELDDLEQAVSYAKKRAEFLALKESKERGILGEPDTKTEVTEKMYPDTDMLDQVIVRVIVQEKSNKL